LLRSSARSDVTQKHSFKLYKKPLQIKFWIGFLLFDGIQKNFSLKANGMTNKTPKGNFLSFSGVCFQ
jgi:hypothetical protein